jgi:hypothetical protein
MDVWWHWEKICKECLKLRQEEEEDEEQNSIKRGLIFLIFGKILS